MEKMEGIVMKNIQERAREYADRHKAAEIIGKVYGYERIYNAEMAAYERGATDQKAIDDAGLYKLKERWEKEAQINHDRDIKSIKERAKLASEDYACDDSYSAGFFTGYVEGATKQKAIDEEVRLKKSDDMTQAEYDREVAFADWYLKNGKGTPTYSDAIDVEAIKAYEEMMGTVSESIKTEWRDFSYIASELHRRKIETIIDKERGDIRLKDEATGKVIVFRNLSEVKAFALGLDLGVKNAEYMVFCGLLSPICKEEWK